MTATDLRRVMIANDSREGIGEAPADAALTRRLGATLTMLGTAARHGVAKLVIGNTAEDLIGRLESDLVTVREPWS